MFNVGDLIIYGSEGVCRVESIGVPENKGTGCGRLYYTLTPVYRNGRVLTPVDVAVFMRPIVERGEAERLIESIPMLHAEIFNERNLKKLTDYYKLSIQSYECADLAKLIKSIRMKRSEAVKNGRKLGAIDERYLKRAEDMLYGELAVALDKTPAEIKAYIDDRFNNNNNG